MSTPELEVRDATPADATAIADLLNSHSIALFDESDLTPATVEAWFKLPRVVWFGVAERDGDVVGYADLHQNQEHAAIDARTLEAAAMAPLVDACIERALPGAPVWGYAPAKDEFAAAAYRAAGFTTIRHSFSMLTELTGETPAPDWPEGVEVRPWRDGDDRVFHATLQETFSGHFGFEPTPYDEWLRATGAQPETDRSLWYLARAGDVVGVAQCSWHSSGDRTFGWVNELGVRDAWRRRGLGLALLRHAFVEFARRGATRVGLGVDGENTTGAVRLYERAGMHVTRRYDTWELRR